MTSLESMTAKLSPLGVYNIEDGSNIKNELASYACALDVHRSNIDALLRECFISSSLDYGIEIREKVIGALKSNYSLDKRREMLIIRKGFNENDFTLSSLYKFLKGLGITDCSVNEQPSKNTVSVRVGGSYSDSEAKWIESQIKLILPAHLESVVYFE